MYGLPQAGKLAHDDLVKHLPRGGYFPTTYTSVSNNEYLPVEERGNIINGGTAKLHKLQPEKQPDM